MRERKCLTGWLHDLRVGKNLSQLEAWDTWHKIRKEGTRVKSERKKMSNGVTTWFKGDEGGKKEVSDEIFMYWILSLFVLVVFFWILLVSVGCDSLLYLCIHFLNWNNTHRAYPTSFAVLFLPLAITVPIRIVFLSLSVYVIHMCHILMQI